MHIQLETTHSKSIEGYSDEGIKTGGIIYQCSLLISPQKLVANWPVQAVSELNLENMQAVLELNPEIVILGQKIQAFVPPEITAWLASKRIGLESMSLGAACRSYNVLLSEGRAVVLGLCYSRAGE